ncbi:MAG: peptidoglycan-binding protein [Parasporobacterium sp.]|nr:peptidoglycan-binding protein [Parasporobacterium sp.]
MKNRVFLNCIIVVLLFSLLFAGTTLASQDSAPESKAVETKLEVINSTGKEIVYFTVFEYDENYDPAEEVRRMQEALIEQKFLDDVADGSYGPKTQEAVIAFRKAKGLSEEDLADTEMLTLLYGDYDDGNLLEESKTWKDGETAKFTWEAEETEVSDDQFVTIPDFRGTVKFKDDEVEYSLHLIPLDNAEKIELHVEEDLLYFTYQTPGSEERISTLEAEKAVYEQEHSTDSYDTYYDDDYYYDYSEDYSYDYSYEDTYYEPQGVDGCIDIDDAMFNP